MPKYTFDEWTLREYAEDEAEKLDLSGYTREEDGALSAYEAAQCELSVADLEATALAALEELQKIGATRLEIRYDGGSDEGFSHFEAAQVGGEHLVVEKVVALLENGVLGEPKEWRYFATENCDSSRAFFARESLETLAYQLAVQLLGHGFGTGEYSLEGRFTADLGAKTLADIAPNEDEN